MIWYEGPRTRNSPRWRDRFACPPRTFGSLVVRPLVEREVKLGIVSRCGYTNASLICTVPLRPSNRLYVGPFVDNFCYRFPFVQTSISIEPGVEVEVTIANSWKQLVAHKLKTSNCWMFIIEAPNTNFAMLKTNNTALLQPATPPIWSRDLRGNGTK